MPHCKPSEDAHTTDDAADANSIQNLILSETRHSQMQQYNGDTRPSRE